MANSTTLVTLPDGRRAVKVTEAKTLAAKDNGVVQNVAVDALTITLPATVVGYCYTIRNAGVAKTSAPTGTGDNKSCLVTIQPNSSDYIAGMEMTASDNKALLNTKLTANVGDEVTLIADGANGWFIERIKGIWAQGS